MLIHARNLVHSAICALLVSVCCFLTVVATRAEPVLRFDPQTGLFDLTLETMSLVRAQPVFWHDEWKWSGLGISSRIEGNFTYTVSGRNEKSGLSLAGKALRTGERDLEWQFTLADTSDFAKQWGGFSFRFSENSLSMARGGKAQGPKILDDKSGWTLDAGGNGATVAVRFDPAPATIFFEKNNPFEIRVYFSAPEERIGTRSFKMTVSLPPAGTIEPPPAERVALPEPGNWGAMQIDPADFPIDLSFLNAPEKPAGKHGFLRAQGGELVFPDGRPAIFWGTNVTAYALFSTGPKTICTQARRLSKMGFNLVRLHHHDSPWVNPNIFGRKASSTLRLDEASLEALDRWISCLKAEGIYVWLDLHTGRAFTAEDGIEDFDEIAKGKPTAEGKGFNYVNASIVAQMKSFAEEFLGHVNGLTGLAYKDDPAVAFILLTNENDVTSHFGNMLLPNKNVPTHNARYMAAAKDFAREHGLDERAVWRAWEHGPSKLFLNDLENRFNADMIAYLRGLGVKSPIITTDFWGNNPMSSLPALTAGDVVNVHDYEEPDFLRFNPDYRATIASRIASAGVYGKPVTVSEWNISPFPALDRAVLPLYVGGAAAFQGWSAMLQYAYAQAPLDRPIRAGNWAFTNDPAMAATMPAAALLFRERHIEPGALAAIVAPSADDFMDRALSASASRTIRLLAEQKSFRVLLPGLPALPWFRTAEAPAGPEIINEVNAGPESLPSPQNGEICTDSGQMCRNWKDGFIRIDTPRSQIAAGWIGGKTIKLKDVEIAAATGYAAVAVQSLDGVPVPQSRKLLITLAAQSLPKEGDPSIMMTEAVRGALKIRALPGLRLAAVGPDGEPAAAVSRYENGEYLIDLRPGLQAPWLMLEAR